MQLTDANDKLNKYGSILPNFEFDPFLIKSLERKIWILDLLD